MATVEQVKKALVAVEELCGKCPVCTPDCPVAIAKRALSGLKYDIEAYEQYQRCRNITAKNHYSF